MVAKKLVASISLALSLIGAVSGSSVDSSKIVTWDQYSLKINGERLFTFSGEFHYYRLPSPDLWADIFEKYKALNFNTASIYFYWGYHSPKQGVYDFEGVRDISKFLETAKKYGINIISRAGPYINAEVSEGGFPGWLTNIKGVARTNATDYEAAWKEWLTAVDKHLVPNQIGNGGPIILNQIENEYSVGGVPSYMAAVEAKYKADGMTVPTTFNDAWTGDHWNTGEGSVDIYGWDNYPVLFDCSHPNVWPSNVSTYFRDFHASTNPTEPMALLEFQSGAIDGWAGAGYEKCRELTNERFAKIYYKNNYAQGATIQNLYMGYGGTSWGEIPTTAAYTSYDYGSPITEAGLMTTKAYEVKLQGAFLRDVKPFVSTTNTTAEVDNDAIRVDGIKDIGSDTTFYIVQHAASNSTNLDKFHVTIDTADGKFAVPRKSGTSIVLNGRDAKIITTSYDFGSQHLLYATSDIFTHIKQDSRDVLLVYAYEGEDGEVAITSSSNKVQTYGTSASVISSLSQNVLQINYKYPDGSAFISATGKNGSELLLIAAGYDTAIKWWAPQTSNGDTVLVSGPYLVRSAEISGTRLALTGDTNSTTSIEIVASSKVSQVTWNGVNIAVKSTKYGTLTGKLSGPKNNIQLPDLTKATWKYSPASPETTNDFDDSKWVAADHQTTTNPFPPASLPVLYSDDYGYHTGSLWFRGKFNSSSDITGIKVNATMGDGSAWVAWLNGKYLGGETGDVQNFKISKSDLATSDENVLSLLMWTTGHEEDWNVNDQYKTPRGFTEVSLTGSKNTSISWKVQGNLGGEDIADPVRGALNEGGLYGERMGWHLPGYPDQKWKSVSVPDTKRSGVSWYRTTFNLNIPKGYDVPLGIRFDNSGTERLRALLFINGWQFGKFANDLGPQSLFYAPEGILNHHGENTIAIGVIAVDEEVSLGKVTIEPYATLLSGKPRVQTVDSPTYASRKSSN
ncbi:glycoside hydrolase family 35 protein [Umbelopsis sp. PMI_123]|nr:glycoside hydrolase family 35 protein [Umbelopsis sp. PMI_123]